MVLVTEENECDIAKSFGVQVELSQFEGQRTQKIDLKKRGVSIEK